MADLLERKWALFSPLPLILGLGKRRDFMDRDIKQNIAENAPIENPPEGGRGARSFAGSLTRGVYV